MRLLNWVLSWAATLLVLTDGSGSRAQSLQNPDGPDSGSAPGQDRKRLTGTIAGFGGAGAGSVNVGGVWFHTAGAAVWVDGVPGDQGQLQAGQVVTVDGEVDEKSGTGVANRIAYEPGVRGPVGAIDLENNRLTVLGQSISITPDTSIGGGQADPSSLTVGDIVFDGDEEDDDD